MKFSRLIVLWIAVNLIFTGIGYGQLSVRFPAWIIPSKNNVIDGLAIGPFLTKSDSVNAHIQTINGINTELMGKGYQVPFQNKSPYNLIDAANEDVLEYADSADFYNIRVNGINLSTLGTNGDLVKINGLNLSGFASYTGKVNGISASFLVNKSRVLNGIGMGFLASRYNRVTGLQVSFYSDANELKGLQIGIISCTRIIKGVQLSDLYSQAEEIAGVQLGAFNNTNEIKGLQIGYIYSEAEEVKGVQLAYIYSKAEEVKGVQIGFVTKTTKLKGFQFGLWNVNEKRKLPLINFNFKD
jgi:hypothetical protein